MYYRIFTMKSFSEAESKLPSDCCPVDLSPADEERLVAMSRALGNPVRYAIIRFLSTQAACITGDIVNVLPTAQSTTSQHLKVLRDTGWIDGTTDGTTTSYCLNSENVSWFRNHVVRAV
jgi:hypothetical protein